MKPWTADQRWTEERARAWWDRYLPIGQPLRRAEPSDVHVDFDAARLVKSSSSL